MTCARVHLSTYGNIVRHSRLSLIGMLYFTTVDYRDKKKRAKILAAQFAHLVAMIATTLFATGMSEAI
jgi:hypothetical protein